jgi:lipopolysaccharide transport system permease protein
MTTADSSVDLHAARFVSPELRRAASLIGLLSREAFRVRYKRATLGIVWAIVQPTLQAFVLLFVFTQIIKFQRVPNFGIYMLSGVLPWAFFSQSVMGATTSIVENAPLVKKVPVPAVVFPLAGIGGAAITYSISLVVVVVGSAIYGTLGFAIFLLPVALFYQLVVIVAIALLTSAMYPAFRDIRYIVEAVVLLGFYVTPIIWSPSIIHNDTLRTTLSFNPMYGVMQTYRLAVAGFHTNLENTLPGALTTLVILFVGILVFRRRKDEFPDVV